MIISAAVSWHDPLVLAGFLIPGGVASGLAVAAFGLLVNRAQTSIARRKAAAADLARAKAEVRALRAQINPHFLFNALNTIRYLVRTDPPAARRLLLDLSAIFQHALRSGDFVPLQKEIEYVKAYLAVEQTRLEERLQVEWNIEADNRLDHPVPTLILQPIVENAIIHGIARTPGGGKVVITIGQGENELVLQVRDDGPGITPERLAEVLSSHQTESTSIGLRNVDGRLRTLYGSDHGLLVASEGNGTLVEIRIPIEG
jgi:LytS/YehU family sensor histidine kinase